MQTYPVRLRERGQLTIPLPVRESISAQNGDVFNLLEVNGIIMLSPKRLLLPELSEEFSELMDDSGVSLADLLQGLEEERRQIWKERQSHVA